MPQSGLFAQTWLASYASKTWNVTYVMRWETSVPHYHRHQKFVLMLLVPASSSTDRDPEIQSVFCLLTLAPSLCDLIFTTWDVTPNPKLAAFFLTSCYEFLSPLSI